MKKKLKYLVLPLEAPPDYAEGDRDCIVQLTRDNCALLKGCITKAERVFAEEEALTEMCFDCGKLGLEVVVMPCDVWYGKVPSVRAWEVPSIYGIEHVAKRAWMETWDGLADPSDLLSDLWVKCDNILGSAELLVNRKRMRFNMYTEDYGDSDTEDIQVEEMLQFISEEFPDV